MINKAAPSFGGAIGYFVITMWAIPHGYIDEKFIAEAVVMAGILATNGVMELRAILTWIGSLIKKDK